MTTKKLFGLYGTEYLSDGIYWTVCIANSTHLGRLHKLMREEQYDCQYTGLHIKPYEDDSIELDPVMEEGNYA
tara:strand:+ start:786 stop:1004 length:219 start_codon:yes stop_codon:yes gene_type:complete